MRQDMDSLPQMLPREKACKQVSMLSVQDCCNSWVSVSNMAWAAWVLHLTGIPWWVKLSAKDSRNIWGASCHLLVNGGVEKGGRVDWTVDISKAVPVLGVTATFWSGSFFHLWERKQLQETGKELCVGLLRRQMGAMELQKIKQPIAGLSILIFHLARKRVLEDC